MATKVPKVPKIIQQFVGIKLKFRMATDFEPLSSESNLIRSMKQS